MNTVNIPLGEWLPDAPATNNPGCETANNVIPTAYGYQPFKGLNVSDELAFGSVIGAKQIFDNLGNSMLVGGTTDRLFIRRNAAGGFQTTTGYSDPGDGEAWDFAQYNDYIIATAEGNKPKYLADVDSSTSWANLPGTPPNAKRCARVGEFLVLGHVGGVASKIQWSHYNDPTGDWTPSRLTQAGFAILPVADGPVQKIVGGRYGTVFQSRSITRLSYVGPPAVFRADVVSTERGALAPFAVVSVGYMSFFLAQDGFFATNGTSVEPIGGQRVNKWFFDTVAQEAITHTHGAVDWQNRCIVWAFKSQDTTVFDRLLIYNYIDNKWSSATVSVEWLTSSTLDGIDLDSLDAIYTDLDSIPYSLDSDEFKAKDRRLAAFIADGTGDSDYALFTGDPLEATWETGEFQPEPGRRVFVDQVAPVIEADEWDMNIQLNLRDHRGARTASLEKTTGWGGFAPVRGEGHRVSIVATKPSGNWTEATGLDVKFRVAGIR